MCLSVPSRVVALAEGRATVSCFGVRREVSLLLMDEPVQLGDWLLVQAGGLAYERVEESRAREALDLVAELTGAEPYAEEAPATPGGGGLEGSRMEAESMT